MGRDGRAASGRRLHGGRGLHGLRCPPGLRCLPGQRLPGLRSPSVLFDARRVPFRVRGALVGIAAVLVLSGAAWTAPPTVLAEGPGAPVAAGEALAAAREAASADHHAESIRLYRQAFDADPRLRDEAGLELARQLTWAGELEDAIEAFRGFLDRHPERADGWSSLALAQSWNGRTREALDSYRRVLAIDPEDRDARLGEARMLSWLGDLAAARTAYARVAELSPEDLEARLGLAQVTNWRGDHRVAWRLYEAVLAAKPDDRLRDEAVLGLAVARNWAGRPDLAVAALDPADGPRADEARRLAAEIRGGWRWNLLARFDGSEDSDDFEHLAARLEAEAPLRLRGHLRVGVLRNRYSRPGFGDASEVWALVSGDWRASTPWLLTGALRALADRPDRADTSPLEGDLGAAWMPDDRWRLDLAASRLTIFTFEALPDRITGEKLEAGVSFRFLPVATAIVSGDRAWYSDDNNRVNLRGRLRWWAIQKPVRLWTEAGTHYLDYEAWSGNGFWTPDRYRAHYARLDFEADPWRRVTALVGLDGGWAREGTGDLTPYLSYSGGLVVRAGPGRIELSAGHSQANAETGRGYSRTFAVAALSIGL